MNFLLIFEHICLTSVSFLLFSAEKTICVRQPSETNVLIYGGMEAGNFVNLGTVADITECVNKGCDSEKGNIAFLLQQTCFSVICHNIQSCKLEASDTGGTRTAGALYQVIGKLVDEL